MTVKREFELSEEDAAFIDEQAEAEKAQASEVVGSAIKMLREEEAYVDRWIEEEVMPTYERWKAGKEKVYTSEKVFDRLEKRMRKRFSKAS